MTRTKILILALFASLAVNLFVGGLMLGRWWDHHDRPRLSRFETPDGPGPRWLRRAVGKDAMPVLERVWSAHAAEIDPLRAGFHESREAVRSALTAEPFDAVAYAAALAEMRARMDAMHAGVHGVMVDLARELSPEQRRELAERGRKGRPPKSSDR